MRVDSNNQGSGVEGSPSRSTKGAEVPLKAKKKRSADFSAAARFAKPFFDGAGTGRRLAPQKS